MWTEYTDLVVSSTDKKVGRLPKHCLKLYGAIYLSDHFHMPIYGFVSTPYYRFKSYDLCIFMGYPRLVLIHWWFAQFVFWVLALGLPLLLIKSHSTIQMTTLLYWILAMWLLDFWFWWSYFHISTFIKNVSVLSTTRYLRKTRLDAALRSYLQGHFTYFYILSLSRALGHELYWVMVLMSFYVYFIASIFYQMLCNRDNQGFS